jgi:hypothetical protein
MWTATYGPTRNTAITTFGIKRLNAVLYSNDVDHPLYITLMTTHFDLHHYKRVDSIF